MVQMGFLKFLEETLNIKETGCLDGVVRACVLNKMLVFVQANSGECLSVIKCDISTVALDRAKLTALLMFPYKY